MNKRDKKIASAIIGFIVILVGANVIPAINEEPVFAAVFGAGITFLWSLINR